MLDASGNPVTQQVQSVPVTDASGNPVTGMWFWFSWEYYMQKLEKIFTERYLPSSKTTFRGRPIYYVGQLKQVQLSNAFIKSVNLKLP